MLLSGSFLGLENTHANTELTNYSKVLFMQHSVFCDLSTDLQAFDLTGLRANLIRKDNITCKHWGHFIQAISGEDGQLATFYSRHSKFSDISPSQAVDAYKIITKCNYRKLTEHESIKPVISKFNDAAHLYQEEHKRVDGDCAWLVVRKG